MQLRLARLAGNLGRPSELGRSIKRRELPSQYQGKAARLRSTMRLLYVVQEMSAVERAAKEEESVLRSPTLAPSSSEITFVSDPGLRVSFYAGSGFPG
jgi:hypothetical protein